MSTLADDRLLGLVELEVPVDRLDLIRKEDRGRRLVPEIRPDLILVLEKLEVETGSAGNEGGVSAGR
jgi:hypothetical protein